jgi:MFS family permease
VPLVTTPPPRPDEVGPGAGPASFVERWLEARSDELHQLAQRVGHMLAMYGLLVVLGLIMLGVAPLRTRALAAAVAAQPGRSLGFGLLVVLGTVVAIVLLSITVIGIPIAAVLAVAASCAAALGLTGVSILIGEILPFSSRKDRQAVKLLLGAGVLVVALAIPYVGGVLGVVATVLGLGSLAITRLRPGHAVFFGHGKGPYRSAV